jgi:hypothetical protein
MKKIDAGVRAAEEEEKSKKREEEHNKRITRQIERLNKLSIHGLMRTREKYQRDLLKLALDKLNHEQVMEAKLAILRRLRGPDCSGGKCEEEKKYLEKLQRVYKKLSPGEWSDTCYMAGVNNNTQADPAVYAEENSNGDACNRCLRRSNRCGWCATENICLEAPPKNGQDGPTFGDNCRTAWAHVDGKSCEDLGLVKEGINIEKDADGDNIETVNYVGPDDILDPECKDFSGSPGDCERAKLAKVAEDEQRPGPAGAANTVVALLQLQEERMSNFMALGATAPAAAVSGEKGDTTGSSGASGETGASAATGGEKEEPKKDVGPEDDSDDEKQLPIVSVSASVVMKGYTKDSFSDEMQTAFLDGMGEFAHVNGKEDVTVKEVVKPSAEGEGSPDGDIEIDFSIKTKDVAKAGDLVKLLLTVKEETGANSLTAALKKKGMTSTKELALAKDPEKKTVESAGGDGDVKEAKEEDLEDSDIAPPPEKAKEIKVTSASGASGAAAASGPADVLKEADAAATEAEDVLGLGPATGATGGDSAEEAEDADPPLPGDEVLESMYTSSDERKLDEIKEKKERKEDMEKLEEKATAKGGVEAAAKEREEAELLGEPVAELAVPEGFSGNGSKTTGASGASGGAGTGATGTAAESESLAEEAKFKTELINAKVAELERKEEKDANKLSDTDALLGNEDDFSRLEFDKDTTTCAAQHDDKGQPFTNVSEAGCVSNKNAKGKSCCYDKEADHCYACELSDAPIKRDCPFDKTHPQSPCASAKCITVSGLPKVDHKTGQLNPECVVYAKGYCTSVNPADKGCKANPGVRLALGLDDETKVEEELERTLPSRDYIVEAALHLVGHGLREEAFNLETRHLVKMVVASLAKLPISHVKMTSVENIDSLTGSPKLEEAESSDESTEAGDDSADLSQAMKFLQYQSAAAGLHRFRGEKISLVSSGRGQHVLQASDMPHLAKFAAAAAESEAYADGETPAAASGSASASASSGGTGASGITGASGATGPLEEPEPTDAVLVRLRIKKLTEVKAHEVVKMIGSAVSDKNETGMVKSFDRVGLDVTAIALDEPPLIIKDEMKGSGSGSSSFSSSSFAAGSEAEQPKKKCLFDKGDPRCPCNHDFCKKKAGGEPLKCIEYTKFYCVDLNPSDLGCSNPDVVGVLDKMESVEKAVRKAENPIVAVVSSEMTLAGYTAAAFAKEDVQASFCKGIAVTMKVKQEAVQITGVKDAKPAETGAGGISELLQIQERARTLARTMLRRVASRAGVGVAASPSVDVDFTVTSDDEVVANAVVNRLEKAQEEGSGSLVQSLQKSGLANVETIEITKKPEKKVTAAKAVPQGKTVPLPNIDAPADSLRKQLDEQSVEEEKAETEALKEAAVSGDKALSAVANATMKDKNVDPGAEAFALDSMKMIKLHAAAPQWSVGLPQGHGHLLKAKPSFSDHRPHLGEDIQNVYRKRWACTSHECLKNLDGVISRLMRDDDSPNNVHMQHDVPAQTESIFGKTDDGLEDN